MAAGSAVSIDWSAAASVAAAACSAIAAVASAYVAFRAYRTQDKSADFGDCLQVVGLLREAQKRVYDANLQCNRELYEFEFVELLNLFEALALLYNDGKIASSTRDFTKKFLGEALAWVEKDQEMKSLMHDAMTDSETFHELIRFNPSLRRPDPLPAN